MDNGHVWLSRLGEVRMFMHRPVDGSISTLSVKHDSAGDWFITVTAGKYRNSGTETHEERNEKEPHANSPGFMNPIGIDLGLRALITTSDGIQIEPPEFLRKSEKKLVKAQRQLSRKMKGSGKRRKARTRVAKVHRKTERQRDDFSHKLSNALVKEHDLITFEDLNVTGMVKNHHLAKSIGDAGWNRIVQYTMYKAESAGTVVILVNPRDTSRKCSRCGNVRKDLKLSDRIYHCDACNLTMDRDMNAAINIRNAGLNAVGRDTPEVTPVEIRALPAMVTPVAETGSPLR
jgi:putative transposase